MSTHTRRPVTDQDPTATRTGTDRPGFADDDPTAGRTAVATAMASEGAKAIADPAPLDPPAAAESPDDEHADVAPKPAVSRRARTSRRRVPISGVRRCRRGPPGRPCADSRTAAPSGPDGPTLSGPAHAPRPTSSMPTTTVFPPSHRSRSIRSDGTTWWRRAIVARPRPPLDPMSGRLPGRASGPRRAPRSARGVSSATRRRGRPRPRRS